MQLFQHKRKELQILFMVQKFATIKDYSQAIEKLEGTLSADQMRERGL